MWVIQILYKNMLWFGFFNKCVIHMLGLVLKSRANLSLFFYWNLSTFLHGPWSSCLEKGKDKTEQSLSFILEFLASLESKG